MALLQKYLLFSFQMNDTMRPVFFYTFYYFINYIFLYFTHLYTNTLYILLYFITF